jgi:chromosome segregation ATPase
MDEVGGGMGTYKRRKFGEAQATENANCALFSPMMTVGRKKKRILDHGDGRESEIDGLRNQNSSLKSQLDSARSEVNDKAIENARILSENRMLKKAVRAQHEQIQSGTKEVQSLRQSGTELLNHVRKLETENYALKAHLEQVAQGQGGLGGGSGLDGRPPDVF